ncbi:glycosyltransferase [Rubricoccus marinus]|uniref:Glycosyltransferase 2-like domain-containing protein n=1 Tax=Rubricoccus marinus TaxID=716817 RepID=A0A259TXC6_9BACT|nr:glycosyltransferase [Rubricoccus marinus]OZC02350.1 hypothetical protein BSZ36_04780 [Rubricoccus marinus]
MTTAFGLLLVGLGVHYAVHLGRSGAAFARAMRASDAEPLAPEAALPVVTVVVAARNEEASIEACVRSILASDYPEDRLEVIVADDDSTDATAAIVRRVQKAVNASVPARGLVLAGDDEPEPLADAPPERLRLLSIPHDPLRIRAHKKRAIETGVGHARGEIVLTTDADCVVPPSWVRAMADGLADQGTALVSGPVRFDGSGGLFGRMQALDFVGMMALGAGGILLGQPHLANGASLGYRRDAFERLGGFDGIDDVTSGDDELLMQKLAYAPAGRDTPTTGVRFVARPDAAVVTQPARTLRQFTAQRLRWASKGAHYPARLQFLIAQVGGFYVMLLVGTLGLPLWPAFGAWLLAGFLLKTAGDLSLLVPATGLLRQRRLLALYPLYALLHIPQTLLAGLGGAMGAGFEWKGRRLDR